MLHLLLHILVPALLAQLAEKRGRAFIIMMATMAVDLDHLLADPIYDPNRCSIGFHPLHTQPAILAYAVLVLLPKLRWVGIGLLIHMALDFADCHGFP